MRLAIMQPYLFPYVGYFQLLHCADAFVALDDVAFIKKGWINRNRILVNRAAHLFTLPLAGSSQHRLIKDIDLLPDDRARRKLLATLQQAYHRAPYFEPVFALVAQVLLAPHTNLTTLALDSLERVNAYLGRPVPLVRSSALAKNEQATGQERIIDICRRLGAHEYVNLQGGAALYTAPAFWRQGIRLRFLQPTLAPYPQRSPAFVPGLSIIDVLMHNAPAAARALVLQADLREEVTAYSCAA